MDLRILTKSILPESQLKEVLYTIELKLLNLSPKFMCLFTFITKIQVDIPWNWDVLFAELLPELSLDKNKTSV